MVKKNKNRTDELLDIYQRLFDRFGPQHWWPGETKTEIVIGAILTQNTNWGNVERAIANLKKARAVNFRVLGAMPQSVLAEHIRPSGYFNIKARRLKNFVQFFMKEMKGSWRALAALPLNEARERVLSVNGVGPETADSILLYAFDRPTFVIDAYTKRIFGRYGLCARDAEYHDLQAVFMRDLPSDVPLFNEYHALIVRLAKDHCRIQPGCAGCPLAGRCRKRLI